MSQKDVRLRSKERQSKAEVAETLRRLADRIADNTLTLGEGAEEVTLQLPDEMNLKLKVTEKPKGQSKKQKLEVELSWTEGEGKGGGVRIA